MTVARIFCACLLGFSSIFAHAGTFSTWEQDGSASLINQGQILRLASDASNQSGAGWAPGTLDLASIMSNKANTFEALFSFRVSGSQPALLEGLGMSLMLTSDPLATFKSSAFGLSQFDDGIAFAFSPALNTGVSLQASQAGQAATVLTAVTPVSRVALNMLDSTAVNAKLTVSYSTVYKSWTMSLKMDDSRVGEAWKTVGFAQFSASSFTDLSEVHIGFGASTLNLSHANFDLLSFSAPGMTTVPTVPAPAVPEPETISLTLVALACLGLYSRRRAAR
jgi:hypothetical protein